MMVLERLGFSRRWRKLVFKCLSTASFSVIINGRPMGFFRSSRGVRQGDPLSSFLFIMGMEVLSKMVIKASLASLWQGFTIQRGEEPGLDVSHLLFADDTIIFGKAEIEHVINLRCILLCFEAASGLKINLLKSEVFAVGEVQSISSIAGMMGCKKGLLPTSYLGLPLGASHKSKQVWEPVIERFERRLAGWKRNYISKGGRLTLIKSTLSNLPVYYLSVLKIPKSVAKRLETIQSRFLWGSSENVHKFHLVKWEDAKQPITNGGLGIKSVNEFNCSLHSKWLWRFMNEKDLLWRRVINAKYGSSHNGWSTEVVREPYGCSVWKSISKGWHQMNSLICWSPGSGTTINFWLDPWLADTPLKERFPQAYQLAANKRALIADCFQRTSDGTTWDVTFTRQPNDWEVEEVLKFYEEIYKVKLNDQDADKAIWKPAKDKGFEVKSFYNCLYNHVDEEGSTKPWRITWKLNLPPRIAFFTWEASKERILTQDNLQRRGIVLANVCPLCHCDIESTSHILLHCPWTDKLWEIAWSIAGLKWVRAKKIEDELLAWEGLGRAKENHMLKAFPATLWWLVWKERNKRIFENKASSTRSIINRWTSFLTFWSHSCKDRD